MHVIGTAGHVDHGKTALVTALTGMNPDRLKEEQVREMTIDLGFAWLNLPGGELVGIVDVPGHRDFIENMLAGVGGIDAALFVIAADEGMMPQTREHLAILDLLAVREGIIALTKIDLIKDEDWLDMVELDIRQAVQGTVLAEAPLVRVSARTGAGLEALKQALAERLAKQPERANLGRPRLPVDRVFSVHGFGTVVTGTLADGEFHLGDEVAVLPSGLRGRIRGLQNYHAKVQKANPGSRTAINLAGVDTEQVKRGDVIAFPDSIQPTARLDAFIRLLPGIAAPMRHNREVKFFTGASETMARLRLLDCETLQPGQEGWAQVELIQPVVVAKGDRFILRRPSPGETIGGGEVIDAHPGRRYKRFLPEVVDRLQVLKIGSPDEILVNASVVLGPAPLIDLAQQAGLANAAARPALARLLASGQLIPLTAGDAGAAVPAEGGLVVARPAWDDWRRKIAGELNTYHQANPLKKGMPREALKSRLKLPGPVFNALLQKAVGDGLVTDDGVTLRQPDFKPTLTARQQDTAQRLLAQFARAPYSPPAYKECAAEAGENLVEYLVESGQLIAVSEEVMFRVGDFNVMLAEVRSLLHAQPQVTLAQVRDQFGTSRHYAQAFLEYLDQKGITQRVGDARTLRDK